MAYQKLMKRCVFFLVLICMISCAGEVRGEAAKRDSKRKRAAVHSDASRFGHKIERAFRSFGGHLQKFFTGHDTISR